MLYFYSPLKNGVTPLLKASDGGYEGIVRLLLESGAQDLPNKVLNVTNSDINSVCVPIVLNRLFACDSTYLLILNSAHGLHCCLEVLTILY